MTKAAEYSRKFRKRHPGYAKKMYRENRQHFIDAQRRKNYGPTAPAHYKKRLKKQKGKCAICRQKMKVPHLDHNHITGKLRDLLCHGCNIKVGVLESRLYLKVVKYLKRHSTERS